MISGRQQAYLDAMDIDVWLLRGSSQPETVVAANELELKMGPGSGGVLLICALDSDSASRLANDISRAMGSNPVWAWPHAGAGSIMLAKAIEDSLFTTVAIFGDSLASALFDGSLPASLKSANIVLLPAMQDLQDSGDARKLLWITLCRSGMVSIGDRQT